MRKIIIFLTIIIILFSVLNVKTAKAVQQAGWYITSNTFFEWWQGNGYLGIRTNYYATDYSFSADPSSGQGSIYTYYLTVSVNGNPISNVTISNCGGVYINGQVLMTRIILKTNTSFAINSYIEIHFNIKVSNVYVYTLNAYRTFDNIEGYIAGYLTTITSTGNGIYKFDEPFVNINLTNINCSTHQYTFSISSVSGTINTVANVSTTPTMYNEYVKSFTYSSGTIIVTMDAASPQNMKVRFYVTMTVNNTQQTIFYDYSFTNTCAQQQTVTTGHLIILEPVEQLNIPVSDVSQPIQIHIRLAYGGNINDISLYANTQWVVGIIRTSPTGQSFTNSYTISTSKSDWTFDGTNSYLDVNLTLGVLDPHATMDVTYKAAIYQMTSQVPLIWSDNEVRIVVGTPSTSTGNALLDWLIKVWNEFKDWFINTMRYLFVPNASDIGQYLSQNWIQPANVYLPNVTPQYTLSIKMPGVFWGQTQSYSVSLDFSQVKNWDGYNYYLIGARVLVWLLFAYIILRFIT
ncbi:MAG: hypothetical protein QW575_07315 [Thermoproteota archaeon]